MREGLVMLDHDNAVLKRLLAQGCRVSVQTRLVARRPVRTTVIARRPDGTKAQGWGATPDEA